jgi:hypothetical protein
MPRFDAALALGALLALCACATQGNVLKPCPSYGILHDAETLSAFAPGGQDAASLAYRVTLTSTSLKCKYHGYKGAGPGREDDSARRRPRNHGRVSGSLSFDIVIESGPSVSDSEVSVPYFVAITRGKKFILGREEFAERMRVVSGRVSREQVEVPVNIPLAADTTGASYEVIVGLALTPEQLAYNRRQSER